MPCCTPFASPPPPACGFLPGLLRHPLGGEDITPMPAANALHRDVALGHNTKRFRYQLTSHTANPSRETKSIWRISVFSAKSDRNLSFLISFAMAIVLCFTLLNYKETKKQINSTINNSPFVPSIYRYRIERRSSPFVALSIQQLLPHKLAKSSTIFF